jgi:hypothetical protein
MENYLPILRSLHHHGVNFAAIGTWALKGYFPEKLQHYVLQDCDIVLAPEEKNIRLAISVLNANAWATTVWDQSMDAGTPSPEFVGKYYVRAKQKDLVLDLTYECLLDWQEIQASRQLRMGLPFASLAHIALLKRTKGRANDIELLRILGLQE